MNDSTETTKSMKKKMIQFFNMLYIVYFQFVFYILLEIIIFVSLIELLAQI